MYILMLHVAGFDICILLHAEIYGCPSTPKHTSIHILILSFRRLWCHSYSA